MLLIAVASIVVFVNTKNIVDSSPRYFARCLLNYSDDCLKLGIFYLEKAKFKKAYRSFDKACKLGNMQGCYNLGLMHSRDDMGLNANYLTAIKFYDIACKQNYSNACINLSSIYTTHFPTLENNKTAFNLLRGVCNNGNVMSCYNVGIFYTNGVGTKPNLDEAVKAFYMHVTGTIQTLVGS